MVGKEIASNPNLLIWDLEADPQEGDKEAHHLWVGIDKSRGVAVPRTLGPKQHASGNVKFRAAAGALPPLLLVTDPLCATSGRVISGSKQLTVVCGVPLSKHLL